MKMLQQPSAAFRSITAIVSAAFTTTTTSSWLEKSRISMRRRPRMDRTTTTFSSSFSSSSLRSNNNNNHDGSIATVVLKRTVQSKSFRNGNQLIYRKSVAAVFDNNDNTKKTVSPPQKVNTKNSSKNSSAVSSLITGQVVRVAVEEKSGDSTTPIGYGVYNSYSLYTIRLLCHATLQPTLYQALLSSSSSNDDEMMIQMVVQYHVRAAIQLRHYLQLHMFGSTSTTHRSSSSNTNPDSHDHHPNTTTDTFRLINGEGDGLSGLAVDVIGGNHVVVMSSAAWCEIYRPIITNVLQTECDAAAGGGPTESSSRVSIIWKTAPARLKQDGLVVDPTNMDTATQNSRNNHHKNDDDDDEFTTATTTTDTTDDRTTTNSVEQVHDTHPMVLSIENGIYYETYPSANGQKTGVYSDQRSNRLLLASYCRDKRVLDLCCYTGGFALNAMIHGGAASCVGVDSSPVAVAACVANAQRNGLQDDHHHRLSFLQSDITTYLQQAIRDGTEYDVVILDPPKLAPSIKLLDKAKRKYHALNRDAISIISDENGGLLLSCTCSAAMTQDEGGQTFLKMIQNAAQSCSKHVTLLSVHGAAACHVQSPMAFPASNYLTAALFYVHPKR